MITRSSVLANKSVSSTFPSSLHPEAHWFNPSFYLLLFTWASVVTSSLDFASILFTLAEKMQSYIIKREKKADLVTPVLQTSDQFLSSWKIKKSNSFTSFQALPAWLQVSEVSVLFYIQAWHIHTPNRRENLCFYTSMPFISLSPLIFCADPLLLELFLALSDTISDVLNNLHWPVHLIRSEWLGYLSLSSVGSLLLKGGGAPLFISLTPNTAPGTCWRTC